VRDKKEVLKDLEEAKSMYPKEYQEKLELSWHIEELREELKFIEAAMSE
tara:strand:+ start:545 stop:691 length:147 start_codon:yes stop_codon:yes gene_type:complete